MSSLSSLDRQQNLKILQSEQYDLVVVGGGITGAGIALDASSRGLKVALIEKKDFASGTSSKSTKLIHGGLRYLKQFEVGLVREVGRERAIVHKLAPHLVIPEKMLLPFTKGGTFGYWSTSLALKAYDILAGVSGDDQRKMLSRESTMQEEPLLRKDILEGAGLYAEYRTDDARLTIENLKLAAQYGALPINYLDADQMIYNEKGQVEGVHCSDVLSDRKIKVKAKIVVNATGPWADELRKEDNSLKGKHLFLSKGIHIVIPHHRIPVKHSLYIDTPDGRMIFIIPRLEVTYIGTTDTKYEGDKNAVYAEKKEVQYLLDAVNIMLPSCGLTVEDVVSSWAGLRPLIHEEGKSPSELSRKDEIFESSTGLLSIAGGKLTGYRKMAERIVDLVTDRIANEENRRFQPCKTDKLILGGGPFENSREVIAYVETIKKKINPLNLPTYMAAYLVYNYGKQSEELIEKMHQFRDQSPGVQPEVALAKAELEYGVKNELVIHPEDFFNRRTGRLYFNIDTIPTILEAVLEDMKKYFKWSLEEFKMQKENILTQIKRLSTFV